MEEEPQPQKITLLLVITTIFAVSLVGATVYSMVKYKEIQQTDNRILALLIFQLLSAFLFLVVPWFSIFVLKKYISDTYLLYMTVSVLILYVVLNSALYYYISQLMNDQSSLHTFADSVFYSTVSYLVAIAMLISYLIYSTSTRCKVGGEVLELKKQITQQQQKLQRVQQAQEKVEAEKYKLEQEVSEIKRQKKETREKIPVFAQKTPAPASKNVPGQYVRPPGYFNNPLLQKKKEKQD